MRFKEFLAESFGNKIKEKDLVKGARFRVKKNDIEFTVEILDVVNEFEVKYTTGNGEKIKSKHDVLAMLNYSESVVQERATMSQFVSFALIAGDIEKKVPSGPIPFEVVQDVIIKTGWPLDKKFGEHTLVELVCSYLVAEDKRELSFSEPSHIKTLYDNGTLKHSLS
jgi:hypothetical protein